MECKNGLPQIKNSHVKMVQAIFKNLYTPLKVVVAKCGQFFVFIFPDLHYNIYNVPRTTQSWSTDLVK